MIRPHARILIPILALVTGLSQNACFTTGGGYGTQYLYGIGNGEPVDPSQGIDNVSYWDGDGVSGAPLIRINLGEQKAYFFKGSELVGVAMISSGREGFSTPRGSFKIIQKNLDHRSNLYGEIYDGAGNLVNRDADIKKDPIPPGGRFVGAPMPHFMRIYRGVGMHTGYLPGFAASHGCIRLPDHMAKKFFANVSLGTPVIVE
jgi:hypothetical protein